MLSIRICLQNKFRESEPILLSARLAWSDLIAFSERGGRLVGKGRSLGQGSKQRKDQTICILHQSCTHLVVESRQAIAEGASTFAHKRKFAKHHKPLFVARFAIHGMECEYSRKKFVHARNVYIQEMFTFKKCVCSRNVYIQEMCTFTKCVYSRNVYVYEMCIFTEKVFSGNVYGHTMRVFAS